MSDSRQRPAIAFSAGCHPPSNLCPRPNGRGEWKVCYDFFADTDIRHPLYNPAKDPSESLNLCRRIPATLGACC